MNAVFDDNDDWCDFCYQTEPQASCDCTDCCQNASETHHADSTQPSCDGAEPSHGDDQSSYEDDDDAIRQILTEVEEQEVRANYPKRLRQRPGVGFLV